MIPIPDDADQRSSVIPGEHYHSRFQSSVMEPVNLAGASIKYSPKIKDISVLKGNADKNILRLA